MSSIARLTPPSTSLTTPLASFRASHGDPITWTTADMDAWLTASDMQSAGADDACPVCGWWTCRCTDNVTLAAQDALRDIAADLAAQTDTADDEEQGGTPLAQVNRPTERAANLTSRSLPTLDRAIELLRGARGVGDREGIRVFSRLIDRILDAREAAAAQVSTDADLNEEADVTAAANTNEDLAPREQLPSAPVTRLTTRRTGSAARGWAA
jgi:hypothetical protein